MIFRGAGHQAISITDHLLRKKWEPLAVAAIYAKLNVITGKIATRPLMK